MLKEQSLVRKRQHQHRVCVGLDFLFKLMLKSVSLLSDSSDISLVSLSGWATPRIPFKGVCAAELHIQAHAEGCQLGVWHWWHRFRTLRWSRCVKLSSTPVHLGGVWSCPCPPGAQLQTCLCWLCGKLRLPHNLLEGLSSSCIVSHLVGITCWITVLRTLYTVLLRLVNVHFIQPIVFFQLVSCLSEFLAKLDCQFLLTDVFGFLFNQLVLQLCIF